MQSLKNAHFNSIPGLIDNCNQQSIRFQSIKSTNQLTEKNNFMSNEVIQIDIHVLVHQIKTNLKSKNKFHVRV